MKRIVLVLLCAMVFVGLKAQDTLSITLSQVQAEFLTKNLSLMAQRYNMDVSEALIKQSRIFSNPNLFINREFYSGETRKFFKSGPVAEYSLQLQQLFSIAGKRRNQIEMAKIGYNISQLSYLDLLRNLKFQISSTFYQLYFLQQAYLLFQMEETSIDRVVKAYKEQKGIGNVSEKDYLRMVALRESLEHQKLEVEDQQVGLQSDLNVLLCTHGKWYRPVMENSWKAGLKADKLPLVQSVVDSAATNRPDVKMAQANMLMAQQNLKLQKSMAVPDVMLGGAYDRIGGPTKDFVGLTATFELPLFNRNQGNIRSAKAAVNMAQAQSTEQYNRAYEEVLSSYQQVLLYHQSINRADNSYMDSYKGVVDAALQQYLQRNMSLLEFIDLYDSYKENQLQWNDRWMKYLIAKEDLNFKVGSLIIK